MKTIPLTNSEKVALVDDEDFEYLSQFKWKINEVKQGVFRRKTTNKKQSTFYIHRVIMNAQPGQYVDHINHNVTDNRRCNLRICTNAQNAYNQRPQRFPGKNSPFKGVTLDKRVNRWQAKIHHNGKHTHLGMFATDREAAKCYNQAAQRLFGEFACLNPV